jgi:hypothetical protein
VWKYEPRQKITRRKTKVKVKKFLNMPNKAAEGYRMVKHPDFETIYT